MTWSTEYGRLGPVAALQGSFAHYCSGKIFHQSTLIGIDQWIRGGGIMITFGDPNWQSLETQHMTAAAWMVRQKGNAAPRPVIAAAQGV
jgi:hypothetical protein